MNIFDANVKEDNQYLFECAELKEREREFLDNSQIERLINGKDINDFCKVLQETFYAGYIDQIKKENSLSGLIFSESKNNLDYLEKRLKPVHRSLLKFFLLDTDLHNVKLIMKARILGKDLSGLFLPDHYSYENLYKYLEGENAEIDNLTKKIVDYGKSLMSQQDVPFRIVELKLEAYYLTLLADIIRPVKSIALQNLLKHRIDILNIKNVYRSKIVNEKYSYDDFLYDGGFLDREFFKKFEKESVDYFAQAIEKTEYTRMIMQGTHMFYSEQTFSSFESNEDIFILKYFDSIKYTTANLEKIVGFFLKKRIERRNLNIIFTGVIYNLNKERIKHRIPVYD